MAKTDRKKKMALSKPAIPDTVQDEPVIGQHYLVCGTENCKSNCQFYCNPCHKPMCEQCTNEHQKSPATTNHEVVSYRQRKRQLPVEKCMDHPTKDIDMFCEDCQVPLCSKCVIKDHQKHMLHDLEAIYSEGFTLCLDEIYKIHQYFLPTLHDIQEDIKDNFKEIESLMDEIRASMRAEGQSLKSLIDKVTLYNIEQVNEMEVSLKEMLQNQDKTYKDYISYLNDLVKKFDAFLSSTKIKDNPIILSLSDHLKVQPIPETTKPVLPVFIAGQYSKEDVTKLLGRVTVPDTKPEKREIKPMKTASKLLKPTLSLSSSVTKVREYTIPVIDNVWHITQNKLNGLWISNSRGDFVQTDLQGNQVKKIKTSGKSEGYHTVTQDGEVIFADRKNKVIRRITLDNIINEFIKTRDWEPISVYSSHVNGDALVGMRNSVEAKVTRYDKTGKEIQKIQWDNKGQNLYSDPHYITENINGDICTSDFIKQAVVVVDKSGQYRFSYTGQGSEFYPFGICTDILFHIIVCDGVSNTVHLLDQNGQFLFLLLTEQQGITYPRSVCVDNESNLQVGQRYTNTVTVYKYLQ